ncbi:MAG: xanthine dehydrogenase family protein molybdopterin-binding subunit, partial [Flavobacteriaceae bacterium]
MTDKGIGASVRRVEDQRFITGKGNYTADISRPGQAHAYFLRSPHAHAKIASIDAKAAASAPGVLGVFTGDDLARDSLGPLPCGWMIHSKDGSPMKTPGHPMLAQGKVRYVGDPVVMVVAETYAQARDAAEMVEVNYDVLPAVVETAKTQASGAPQIFDEAPRNTAYEWEIGDKDAVSAAFAKAAHVTRVDIVNNRLVPNAMEPRAAVGDYDSGTGVYTCYTTSQNPHVARLVMSAFLNLAAEHKLRVIAPDVGGGFGSKIYVYSEETLCTWAAKHVGRPVKWTAERSESFLSDAHGRDHVSHAEMAMDERGKILALKVKTIANVGGYMNLFASCVPTYLYATLLSGQYDIPAIYAEVDAVYTNTVPVDAYRGAGRPEATYLLERTVEIAAREMGIDPGTFRKRNFVKSFPHQTPVIMCYDAGDYAASLTKAQELIDYKGFGKRRKASAKAGKLRGIGFSTY